MERKQCEICGDWVFTIKNDLAERYESHLKECTKLKEKYGDLKLMKIVGEIKQFKDKGTEPAPETYQELFIRIMEYGGLDKEDIERYFRYM